MEKHRHIPYICYNRQKNISIIITIKHEYKLQLHESKLQLHKSKLQFLLLCSVTDRCCRTHNPEIQGMFSFVVLVASSLCCFSLAWREIFSDYISRNFQDGSWPSAPTHTSAQNPEERLDSELDPKTQKENTMFWLLI